MKRIGIVKRIDGKNELYLDSGLYASDLELSDEFKSKLEIMKPGTQVLIETDDSGEYKRRANDTLIIRRYSDEQRYKDALEFAVKKLEGTSFHKLSKSLKNVLNGYPLE